MVDGTVLSSHEPQQLQDLAVPATILARQNYMLGAARCKAYPMPEVAGCGCGCLFACHLVPWHFTAL